MGGEDAALTQWLQSIALPGTAAQLRGMGVTLFSDLQYLDFLREYGKHFSINRMLTFESVKQRLERESPLSFLEFNYMILQAYDFLELSRRHDAALQFGGSDQWGNIINGGAAG